MAMRTLRRKVIIREYDFHKVKADVINTGFARQYILYDRAEFVPLNQENLEKLKLWEILRGRNTKLTQVSMENPQGLLFDLSDYLYNPNYLNWRISVDNDGYVCVQSRTNTPKSRIGWGVFEKDLESRL